MMIVRKIDLYERIPVGYAPAWRDWGSDRDVCFPIGLHWLVRWARAFWLWTLGPTHEETEMGKRLARERKLAYDRGYAFGWMAAKRQVVKGLHERMN